MNCTKCGKKIGGFSNYGDSNNPQCFDCSGSVPCASCNNNMPVGESITHENKRICRRCHDKHMAEAATLQKADSYADPFELENIHLDYAAKNFSVHWLINPVIIGLVFVLAGLLGITIFSTLTLDDYFVRIWWYESEGILMILNLVFSILAIGYGIFLCLQPSALFVIQEDYLIYKNKRYYIRDIVSAERTNKKLMLQLGNDVISIPYLRLKTKDVQNFIVHLKGYDKHIEHNRKEKSSRNIGKS